MTIPVMVRRTKSVRNIVAMAIFPCMLIGLVDMDLAARGSGLDRSISCQFIDGLSRWTCTKSEELRGKGKTHRTLPVPAFAGLGGKTL